jgi:hypothetical protein
MGDKIIKVIINSPKEIKENKYVIKIIGATTCDTSLSSLSGIKDKKFNQFLVLY